MTAKYQPVDELDIKELFEAIERDISLGQNHWKRLIDGYVKAECNKARIDELSHVTCADGLLMTTLPKTGTLHTVNDRTHQLQQLLKGEK